VRASPDAERELAVLRAVAHPHVVRLHQAVVLDDGRLALVLDLVDGGSLASVVGARGHLSPGEVVTVLAPLAQTVADLHADGVQHGDLAPGNVLFDRTGRPVLSDLGTPRITGEPRDEVFGTAGYVDPVVLAGGRAGPASDVYGLGALAWLALTGSPPESAALRVPLAELAPGVGAALIEAVEAAADPDPARRPDPAQFGSALLAAADPAPVWLPGGGPEVGGLTHRIRVLAAASPDPVDTRRHRARRWPHRRAMLIAASVTTAALLAAAVVAVTAGWPWPGRAHERAPAPIAATAAPTGSARAGAAPTRASVTTPSVSNPRVPATLGSVEVAALVRSLAGRRARLFADPRWPVTDVAVRGSPAAAADDASLAVLRAQGLTYRGLELRTDRVHVVQALPRRVVADVRTATTAYEVVDRSGVPLARARAEPGRTVRLVLSLTDQGWRVQAVLGS